MSWVKKLIEWIKSKLGINSEINLNDIDISLSGEIKSVKIYLYLKGSDGWNAKNLKLISNSNILEVGDISKDSTCPTEVVLDKEFIDSDLIEIKCDFTCNDGEVIKINDAYLKFENDYLNVINKRIVYTLTALNLGLKPIVFGNVTVNNYIKANLI